MSAIDDARPEAPVPALNGAAAPPTRRFLLRGREEEVLGRASESPPGATWTARLDAWYVKLGDGLNPILVKETRQALKSKQFIITFMLTLAAGLFWSLFSVLGQGESIHYSASGGSLFLGYYLMLLFPLLVIVPARTMRSLASEVEDSTYELLEITTIRTGQVIIGKLASAVVQMGIYFAALAPSMAFTYLLNGIDLLTIFYLFFWAFQASIGLSTIGLALATSARNRQGLNALTAFALLGFMNSFGGAVSLAIGTIHDLPILFAQPIFWGANATAVVVINSYLWLFAVGAWGQLRFASANRSTPLRVAMVVQQAVFTGVMAAWIHVLLSLLNNASLVISGCVLALFVNAYAMGGALLGESAEISERVRRTLPQTYLARMLFTWFYPGPGTGLLFTISNLLAAATFAILALAAYFVSADQDLFSNQNLDFAWPCLLQTCLMGFSYIGFYLGVGNVLMLGIARFVPRSRALSLAIQVLLVLIGMAGPELIEQTFVRRPPSDFWMLHAANPFAGMDETFGPYVRYDKGRRNGIASFNVSNSRDELLFYGPLVAFAVLAANVPIVLAQVRLRRISRPARVEEEDAEIRASTQPPKPKVRTNPWDDEAPS